MTIQFEVISIQQSPAATPTSSKTYHLRVVPSNTTPDGTARLVIVGDLGVAVGATISVDFGAKS